MQLALQHRGQARIRSATAEATRMTINDDPPRARSLDSYRRGDADAPAARRTRPERVRTTPGRPPVPEVNTTDEITWDEV